MVQVHGKAEIEEDMSHFAESIDSESSFVVLGPNSVLAEESLQQPPITSLNNISIVSDLTPDEIESKLKDLVKENYELKETLQQNNMAMKEHYVLLSSFQNTQLEKKSDMNNFIMQLQEENAKLKDRLKEQEAEKSISVTSREDKDQIERLSAQKSCLERDIIGLKQEMAALQAGGIRLRQEKEALSVQNQELLIEVREKDSSLRQLEKQVEEIRSNLEEEKKSNFQLKKEQAELRMAPLTAEEPSFQSCSAAPEGSVQDDLGLVKGILEKYGERCQGLNNLLQTWSDSLNILVENLAEDPSSAEKLKQQVSAVQSMLQKQFLQTGLDRQTLKAAQQQINKYVETQQETVRKWGDYKDEQDHKDHQTVALHLYELKSLKEKMDNMTAQLMHKDERLTEKDVEIDNMKQVIMSLELDTEGVGILKAQVELYQADFAAEREARERIVGEKEKIAEELRLLQRQHEALQQQSSNLGPNIVYEERIPGSTDPEPYFNAHEHTPPRAVYECPKCNMKFSTLQAVENHVEVCLQNDMFP